MADREAAAQVQAAKTKSKISNPLFILLIFIIILNGFIPAEFSSIMSLTVISIEVITAFASSETFAS